MCIPFAAGEMKHGPLALIDSGTMVIIIAAKRIALTNLFLMPKRLCRGADKYY